MEPNKEKKGERRGLSASNKKVKRKCKFEKNKDFVIYSSIIT